MIQNFQRIKKIFKLCFFFLLSFCIIGIFVQNFESEMKIRSVFNFLEKFLHFGNRCSKWESLILATRNCYRTVITNKTNMINDISGIVANCSAILSLVVNHVKLYSSHDVKGFVPFRNQTPNKNCFSLTIGVGMQINYGWG